MPLLRPDGQINSFQKWLLKMRLRIWLHMLRDGAWGQEVNTWITETWKWLTVECFLMDIFLQSELIFSLSPTFFYSAISKVRMKIPYSEPSHNNRKIAKLNGKVHAPALQPVKRLIQICATAQITACCTCQGLPVCSRTPQTANRIYWSFYE